MNSQQTQNDFYPNYNGGPLSHSPNPSRPGYATAVGMSSALNGGRRSQPPNESGTQPTPPALYSDDRFTPFEPSQRFDRNGAAASQPGQQSPFGVFGAPNHSAWGYNASSVATIGSAMNDGSRIRASNRRPALHTEWTTNNDALGGQINPNMAFYAPPQHLVGQPPLGLQNTGSPDPFSAQPPAVNLPNYGVPDPRSFEMKKDMGDLIPTAIVIKNIPFNVRKEFLTSVMIDLQLPQPYAFNYHFDQGVFRGLAFANFQNAQDTALVIERMNGLDIQGRKLRVEYKKMLPEHERERIEREKREKRGQLEEQHRGPVHQISISSMATANSVQRTPSATDRTAPRVDMNDPHTLRYYLDLYLFQNDDMREVHIFPADILPEDRRVIHTLAHNMGLEHTSIGDGENRQVHVSKSKFSTGARPPSLQQQGVTLDGHPRGLSRAATYDFNDRQHPSVHSMGRNPTLAIPNSPDNQPPGINGLRGVKSFADLRSFSPSPSPSLVSGGALAPPPTNGHSAGAVPPFLGHYTGEGAFGPSLTTPATPGSALNPGSATAAAAETNGLVNSFGSLGLTSSAFDSGSPSLAVSTRPPRDTPGAIGSQRPGANANSSRVANPERQPRGPGGDWEGVASGFAHSRPNGHAPRGSDSSDNAGRTPSTTQGSSSRF